MQEQKYLYTIPEVAHSLCISKATQTSTNSQTGFYSSRSKGDAQATSGETAERVCNHTSK